MNDTIEKIAFHYDELVKEGNDPFRDPPEMQEYMAEWDGEDFFSMLNLSGRENVLEIGCGTGRLAENVLPVCRAYTGLDVSSRTLARARINLAAVPGTPDRNFICGAFPYCLIPGKFDVIYSSLTFLHIEDKTAAMASLASHLEPGGRIVLSLDKTRTEDIEYIDRLVPVFPDNPVRLKKASAGTALKFAKRIEKEKATLLLLTF